MDYTIGDCITDYYVDRMRMHDQERYINEWTNRILELFRAEQEKLDDSVSEEDKYLERLGVDNE